MLLAATSFLFNELQLDYIPLLSLLLGQATEFLLNNVSRIEVQLPGMGNMNLLFKVFLSFLLPYDGIETSPRATLKHMYRR